MIACAQALLSDDMYPADYPFSTTDAKYPTSDYCFLGLVSLEDPPKHGVREAIGTLRQAGIKVIMVTGTLPTILEFSSDVLWCLPTSRMLTLSFLAISPNIRGPSQDRRGYCSKDQPDSGRNESYHERPNRATC